ncbi:MAG: lipopolysaccharide assembly protein LapA domain-containing protein [Thermodesulfobacteriota bacterium]
MNAKLGLFVALLLGVVVFTLQNTESVDIRFFFWHLSLSRALLIFLVFAIGILIGYLLATLQAGRVGRVGSEKRDMIEPPTGGGG